MQQIGDSDAYIKFRLVRSERSMLIPKELDVAGKTVVVTGAARGIGKGIVRVLAESGAKP